MDFQDDFQEDYEYEIIKELVPESGRPKDFVFGPPKRMKDESMEKYSIRRKVEKMMYQLRMRGGISR